MSLDFLQHVIHALEGDETVLLVTIVRTVGSTPAPALSRMLVSQNGTVLAGTVGGGCIESDIREAAIKVGQSGNPRFLSLGFTEEHVEIGPVCGGSIEILIEPVPPSDRDLYRSLSVLLDQGKDAVVATRFDSKRNRVEKVIVSGLGGESPHTTTPGEHDVAYSRCTKECLMAGQGVRHVVPDGEILFEPFVAHPELFVFGGGHVGRAISQVAALVGYRITVVDDRETFANAERFPHAERTIVTPFDQALRTTKVQPSSFVVIVTRGHQYDEVVLEQALQTQARYIGMIGSRRKVELAMSHLRARGVPEEQLRRVYAPIGIDIGAVSIEEIAISVVAEIIHVRRNAGGTLQHLRVLGES